MKKINKPLFLVLSLTLILMIAGAVSGQSCVCLDQDGILYPANAKADSLCYTFSESEGWLPNGLTKAVCDQQAISSIPAPVNQPVEQQPAPVQLTNLEPQQPEPVVQQSEPVVQQPEPVIQQSEPVIQQSEPVVQQPEPVIQQSEPVIQQSEPVVQQSEPVVQQSEPVIQQSDPVVQQSDPVVQQPEPVVQQPEPVIQQLIPVIQQSDPIDQQPEPVVQQLEQTENPIPVITFLSSGNGTKDEDNDNSLNDANLEKGGNQNDLDNTADNNNNESDPVNDTTDADKNNDPENTFVNDPLNPAADTDKNDDPVITPDNNDNTDPVNATTDADNNDDPVITPDNNENETDPVNNTTDADKNDDPEITPDSDNDKTDPEKTTADNDKDNEPDTTLSEDGDENELGLSSEVMSELAKLLTEEELADLSTLITAEWLEANADQLSEETLAALTAVLVKEEPAAMLLKAPAPAPKVSIEGELKQIMLSTPNGETITTAQVPFVWLYDYQDSTGTAEVTFTLEMTIKTATDSKTRSTTVSSATCENRICKYTENMGDIKQADVTWTVSGSFKDGETTKTIKAGTSQSFKLDVKDPTPPTPPTPEPKPEAPVAESPKDRYTARSLGFYWKPSKNAESYTVEWHNDKGNNGSMKLSAGDESCKKGKCITYATLPGVGHYVWSVTAVNKSGSAKSNELTFDIVSNIAAPRPYRPNGTVFNHTYPSFEWEDVHGGVVEYRVQVVGKYDNRIRMDRWYNVNDIYVGNGVCFVQTDVFLPAGSYSWRVMARNKDLTSGWSSWRDFYVECDYCNFNNAYYNSYANTVPTCSYPVGTITTNTPDFQWRTLTGASYYMVTLYDASGKILFDSQVSNTNCTTELCSWSPNFKLPKNGNYSWSVSGYGGNGSRWGTANGSFTLNAAIVMKSMSFLRPAQNGLLSADAPLIIWTDPGDTTALFHVEIFNSSNTQLFSAELNREQAWCDGQTCSIEFKTIPDADNYRITVTPYSELNTAGDTISLVFSKGGKPLKLNSPKEGSAVTSRPLFRWALDAGAATQYELVLTDAGNNVTTFSPLVCGAIGVTCEDGEAFFSPADPLSIGTYTAKIVTSGAGYISEEVHFTIK